MRRTLFAAMFLLLAPALAHAQLRVVSTTPHAATESAPATTDVVVDGDLAVAAAMISDQADAQLRQAAPQVYAPIDLGVVRYHDTTTRIESITWRRASDTERGGPTRAPGRATQEHRTLSLTWARDGVVAIADITLEARVQIAFTETGGVRGVVVGDTISVSPQLTGLSSLGEQSVPLDGRALGERAVDTNPLAGRHLRGTALVITGVEGDTCHARISAVPAS
jgi:hypothetical protein